MYGNYDGYSKLQNCLDKWPNLSNACRTGHNGLDSGKEAYHCEKLLAPQAQ